MPRIFPRVRERERERVRRVGRGQFVQVQKPLHHFGDGGFLRRAIADNGLLHFARGDFKNFNPSFGNRRHRRAARFAHDERSLQILREEKSFDDADGRAVFFNFFAERPGNFCEAARAFPVFWTGNRAMRQCFGKRSGRLDEAVTGAAQRRIYAEDDFICCAMRDAGGKIARDDFPPRRSFICSNWRKEIPTRKLCQRRRCCKSKNAAQNFCAASGGGQARPDQCPGQF